MKILVGIPCVCGYKHTEDAIKSVLSQRNVDLLLIDNGGNDEIKALFKVYENNERVKIIVNEKNIYVNPAWNQIIKYFLDSEIEQLVIMNSDLILQKDWSEILRGWDKNKTLIPELINDNRKIEQKVKINDLACRKVTSAPGVFITLNKDQAKLVYPITEDCKIWYGDNWIYEILMGAGHEMVIPNNLLAFHGASQTIQRVPEAIDVINNDNALWNSIVNQKMLDVIQKNKL